ncbi:hypothetical protein AJ78_00689 [Emergomyces pasteurianus Ep9510]|uniref:Uncharacterized protein n=1 Tax=Emergomyces pasteurianus Ep9510 TaxID=1447872 RepID=A0A1J9PTV5_9EURO|nr:hypothetical protein AJ78_00689 [Emergomyces pasteurianus Ep9510]
MGALPLGQKDHRTAGGSRPPPSTLLIEAPGGLPLHTPQIKLVKMKMMCGTLLTRQLRSLLEASGCSGCCTDYTSSTAGSYARKAQKTQKSTHALDSYETPPGGFKVKILSGFRKELDTELTAYATSPEQAQETPGPPAGCWAAARTSARQDIHTLTPTPTSTENEPLSRASNAPRPGSGAAGAAGAVGAAAGAARALTPIPKAKKARQAPIDLPRTQAR